MWIRFQRLPHVARSLDDSRLPVLLDRRFHRVARLLPDLFAIFLGVISA